MKELTLTQATFSESDVVRLVQNLLKDDMGSLGEHVFQAVMSQAVEVGKNIHGQVRYTSQEYSEKETKVLDALQEFQTAVVPLKIDPQTVEDVLGDLEAQGAEIGYKPNEGQIKGIRTLCGDTQLGVMIGRAGTGKTTTLRCVVHLHKKAGYDVWGMALSATAASQLEADTGCKSDTIAHYAFYWNKYSEALECLQAATTPQEKKVAQKAINKYSVYLPSSTTLLLVDEAGMVGVGDADGRILGGWDAITGIINKTGAKLILTGDDHQFKPIEAGDVFRKLVHDCRQNVQVPRQFCELTEIKRQIIPWMQEASNHLAELNVATALEMYENQGHIKEQDLNTDVYKAMAQQYFHTTTSHSTKGTVIAATNKECQALNREIRSVLKEQGLLPQEDLVQRGEDGFTVGDKIVFTQNDRGWNTTVDSEKKGFFVQNSMQAVIQSIKPCVVNKETSEKTFEIVASVPEHNATVRFTLDKFKGFAHGYAVTGWKSQGNTFDWVLVKLSRYMDAHALYVSLTRHRHDLLMYYSKEDFPDYKALVQTFSRANVKDLVVDYSVSQEHKEFWQNVQEYKEAGRELMAIGTLARSIDKENKEELGAVWQDYRDMEEERKSLARVILADWEDHKDFVRQAQLTRESLEIIAGVKKRSLSRVEKQAQLVVEHYAAVAQEARQLWTGIRRTHPGTWAKSHPEWQRFKEACAQRGVLANQIFLSPGLHQPFLKETARTLVKQGYTSRKISYSLSTIKTQAEAHQSRLLQEELLKDTTHQDKLKVLIAYTENRDMAGAIWQDIKPKLKEFEGTLLKDSFSKVLSEYTEVRMRRDAAALQIMAQQEDFAVLAQRVGLKLDVEKLTDQARQARRDVLVNTYLVCSEQMTKLEAAHDLNVLIKEEAEREKKPTFSFLYQQGLSLKDIARDALEYQKIKVFESLTTPEERSLFLLLDEYEVQCRKANDLYVQCINEDKENLRPWQSSYYADYKAAREACNALALEVFDRQDYDSVLAMAQRMGLKAKDIDLPELFSRGEQAIRTQHILSYLKAETPQERGEAAIALRQLMEVEKRQKNTPSKTAQQAFYAGIDFKEMSTAAFAYKRACVLGSLTSEKEKQLYHALEAYETALRPANKAYKECLEESKACSLKPWETKKFKDYLCLVTIQDDKAHQLLKGYDAPSIEKIATEMGISVKKLDVEAHRHYLRKTLLLFTQGDITTVPMAAKELLNWLEFDRHSDFKYTFKILREQDLWPKALQESLNDFFLKKRSLKHHQEHAHKQERDGAIRESDGSIKGASYDKSLLSFQEIEQQLKGKMEDLALQLFPTSPTGRSTNQLRFGRKGSISVFIKGPKQGLYANHETGVYGGPLKLIQEQAGLLSPKEAREWARTWLKDNALNALPSFQESDRHKDKPLSVWTPITPVPAGVKEPDIAGNKYLNYMIKKGGQVISRHAYKDEQGALKGYVVRIEKANGDKITPPLAYVRNEKGLHCWKWQAFEKENKTPYGVEQLRLNPSKPVLVVEGEKTADAATLLFPEYVVLTWSGGAVNVGKTNWSCLVDKSVIIWPDHDEGGHKAAHTLKSIINDLNTQKGIDTKASIVNLPDNTPEKWDLADALPPGWTRTMVQQKIQEALPSQTEVKEAESAISHSEENPEKIPVLGIAYSGRAVTQAGNSFTANLEKITLSPLKKPEVYNNQAINQDKTNPAFYNRDQVLQSLTQRGIETIIRDQWVSSKKERRHRDELRFGASGGFMVNVKAGHSHYHSEGGDIFKYVSESRNISYKEALKEVAESLGLSKQVNSRDKALSVKVVPLRDRGLQNHKKALEGSMKPLDKQTMKEISPSASESNVKRDAFKSTLNEPTFLETLPGKSLEIPVIKELLSSEQFNKAHEALQALENKMLLKRKTGEIMTLAEGDMLRAQQKVFKQAFIEYAKDSPLEAVEEAGGILKAYNEGKIDRNLGRGRQEVADYVLKEGLARWAKEFEANNPEKVAQYKKELEVEYQEWIKGSKIAYSNAAVEQFNKAHDKLQAIETKMLSKRKTGELMTFAEGEELRVQQKVFHQAFIEYAKDSPLEAAEKAERILKEEKIDRNLGKGRKQAAGYALQVSMNTLKETHQWDTFVKENAIRAKQWQELSRSMRVLERGLILEL